MSHTRWLVPSGILLLGAVLFLPGLSTRALWHPDETRYAEIAREMLVDGDWVVPHLNTVPYLDKPPLLYWLTALAYRAGGVNEAMARVVPVLAAIFTLLCTGVLGTLVGTRGTGVRAAAICATGVLFLGAARWAFTDMLLTACVTGALTAWFLGMRALESRPPPGPSPGGGRETTDRTPRRWFILCGLAVGLGFLSKGPVAVVLPALAIVPYLACRRQLRLVFQMSPGWVLVVFALVAVPWYLLVQSRRPDFFEFFFVGQNVGGFVGSTRVHHPGRWYTYFVYLPAIWFPWSVFLPAAIGLAWRAIRAGTSTFLFLGLWVLSMFVFWNLCGSKLPSYLLPLFPALAALTAPLFEPEADERGLGGMCFAAAFIGLLGLTLAFAIEAPVGAMSALQRSEAAPIEPAAHILAPFLAAICLWGSLSALLALLVRRSVALWVLVVMVAALGVLGLDVMHSAEPIFSSRPMALRLSSRLRPDDVVAVYEAVDHGLCFTLRRSVLLVGKPGDLDIRTKETDPERRNDPGRVFRTREEFDALCRSAARVWCFVAQKDLDEFHAAIKAPMREVERHGPRVLFTNRPD